MTSDPVHQGNSLYTIGHSNHPIERFLELLKSHRIDLVADVRSQPYSKYCPHFSKAFLQEMLRKAGVKYMFLGRELGGQPDDNRFYDEKGHALYWKIAETEEFGGGLEKLRKESIKHKVALLCSEENPSQCHRRLLITHVLFDAGVPVHHIRGDGRLESEQEIQEEEKTSCQQLTLFDEDPDFTEQTEWKSIQSGLRKKTPPNSSDYFEVQESSASWISG